MTLDCIVCRRQICADHTTCTGELRQMLARMDARRAAEEAERLTELADVQRLTRDGVLA